MILTVRKKLYTRLVDFTNAFAQVHLKKAVYCIYKSAFFS